MSIIKTEGLSHKYGNSWAIRDVNINISKTGVFGLLGPNGAGKSTIMNIICGTLNQSQGNVYINGCDIREESEFAKKEIGFLPQHLPLYLDFTVDEYLVYAAQLRLMEPDIIQKAVEEVKEKCQISHFSGRLIKNLSGGYKQRVGIAQAIIHKPKLIVLDEPTTGLDPNQLIETRKLIRELGRHQTVLLSSHIMSEISQLCQDVIMVDNGTIIFSDSMDAFNSYLDSKIITARFENLIDPKIINAIPGVTKIVAQTDTEFKIYFEGNDGVSKAIIEQSVRNDWQLIEIHFERQILDNVFEQMTNRS